MKGCNQYRQDVFDHDVEQDQIQNAHWQSEFDASEEQRGIDNKYRQDVFDYEKSSAGSSGKVTAPDYLSPSEVSSILNDCVSFAEKGDGALERYLNGLVNNKLIDKDYAAELYDEYRSKEKQKNTTLPIVGTNRVISMW